MSYIVPIHRPSGVRLAHKCHFLSSDAETVVLAKANRLEFYEYQPEHGLVLAYSRSVYGYIIMLESIRPVGSLTDHLFVGTDRYQYFTCSWDSQSKQLKTEQSYVDQGDKTLRDSKENDRVHIDATRRYMTLELFDGIISVIPFIQPSTKKARRDSSALASTIPGSLGEPVQVRMEEIEIRASAFQLSGTDSKESPRIALLWEDNQNKPQLKIREITYSTAGEQPSAELSVVAELHGDLDVGVSHLIPVPPPFSGFLILGERSITYVDPTLQQQQVKPLESQATIWSCWTPVDEARWLLADEYGTLYFLMLVTDGTSISSWQLDELGHASRATCLIYLDAGLVFLGSHSGDSQIVQIHQGGLQIIQIFPNVAPILDLQIMDLGRGTDATTPQTGEFSSGQARLIAAAGAWQDGSIRSVRSGVGLEEIGQIGEIPLITDMWAVSSSGQRKDQDTLICSFVTETRVLRFDDEAGVEEVDDFHGLQLSQPTVLAANIPGQKLLQVHEGGLSIIDLDSSMSALQWRPANRESRITSACANDYLCLLIEDGHKIHLFKLDSQLTEPSMSRVFDPASQISDIAVSQASSTDVCVVAFAQDASVSLLELSTLHTISTTSLGSAGIDIPRMVLLANLLDHTSTTLFVSMADGTVTSFILDAKSRTLGGMAKILLGSEPVFLKALPKTWMDGHDLVNVFASCEQPSLIYGSEGRIVYAAINSDEAARVCYLNSAAYPDAVVVASPTDLKLASIDQARTTQIQTLPIGKTVRCLTYQPGLKVFAMGCVDRIMTQEDDGPQEELRSSVRLADELTFKEVEDYSLGEHELIECITSFEQTPGDEMLDDDDDDDEDEKRVIILVGTSIDAGASGSQDDRGRLLAFSVGARNQKLDLIAQTSFKGAVRSLAMADGLIVTGLVKVVSLYSLSRSHERGSRHSHKFSRLASYRTSTNPLSLSVQRATDDEPTTIAIGDLMKSVSIVQIERIEATHGVTVRMTEIARHFATLWTSAVAAVKSNEWVAADMEGNILTLRHNADAYGDEARRLEVSGEMRLGEVVNKIVPIPSAVAKSQGSLAKGKGRTGSTLDEKPTNGVTGPLGPLVTPQAFIATVEGSIHLLGEVNPSYIDALLRLQTGLASRIVAPGYMPWAKYRAWKTEVRESDEPFRFVDGDMVEQGLLSLSPSGLEDVCRETGLIMPKSEGGLGLTLEQIVGWGEELRRLY